MNFWKSAKGGGEVIFNPKSYIADFGNFKQGFLSMKLIKRGVISGFGACFFSTIVLILTDNFCSNQRELSHNFKYVCWPNVVGGFWLLSAPLF